MGEKMLRVVPWCLDCGLPEHTTGREHKCFYSVELSCPRCGSPVEPVNLGVPADAGRSVNAVIRCTRTGCHLETALHLRLMPMGVYNDDGETHGNARAYRRHKMDSEPPCQECKDWHSRDYVDRKHAEKEAALV
jgi:hypothetical protein